MAKKRGLSVARHEGVFEGLVRHTCGWVNVKGSAFLVGAGCPDCGERILAVEKLSDAEIEEFGLQQKAAELEEDENEGDSDGDEPS